MKIQGFVGPTYNTDAVTWDEQRCINMYPIISEIGTSKSVAALASCPGYTLYATTSGGGPIRAEKTVSSGRAFVISGFKLEEVNVGGTTTVRGTLSTATSKCSVAENGTQLMIVDGTYGYIYNMDTDTFSQILDADFPNGATVVTFIDGYFIVNVPDSPNYAISSPYDGLTWDVTDRSAASSNPDNIVSLANDNGNLFLFGDRSVEIHQNTGAELFPFEIIRGAVIQTGCVAPFSVQAFDNAVAWLGVDEYGNGVVWKASGSSAVRMSTQAIEAAIAGSTDLSESYAYVYHEQGHIFYVLQVHGVDTTLVYDGSTQQWHERSYKNTATNSDEQHRGGSHIFFDKKNLIGDRVTGEIYEQSMALYDHNGVAMHRERISPHLQDEKRNIAFSSFEIDAETGVGLQSGQGSDPKVMMQYSDDGGRTWSAEMWTDIGKAGKYRTRARWGRCGSARDRVWKVRYTEPTFFQLNEAYINNA